MNITEFGMNSLNKAPIKIKKMQGVEEKKCKSAAQRREERFQQD